jgi:hypothetical protein
MGPADIDTDTDIFYQPISLRIPIYLHLYISHRYRYFHFGRYMPKFWPISMHFNRYLADINITDIQSSRYRYRYRDGRYQYPVCRYRYPVCQYQYICISIGRIYWLTHIYRSDPIKHINCFGRIFKIPEIIIRFNKKCPESSKKIILLFRRSDAQYVIGLIFF